MTISTRRFCARPAAVSFDVIGWDIPIPWTAIRFGLTPPAVRMPATERARLGAAGRRRALDRYSWTSVARATVDAYSEAIALAATTRSAHADR